MAMTDWPRSRALMLLLALVPGSVAMAAEPMITTFAGRADEMTDLPDGDGGPATDANIVLPQDVAVDSAGNVYIADYFGQQVRMVDRQGVIHTVAGDPSGGPVVDGGLAVDASIGGVRGVAIVDGDIVFIASGAAVYRVEPDGRIYLHTRGSGVSYIAHDVDAGPDGSVYVSDTGNNRILQMSAAGEVTTVAGNGQPGNGSNGGDGGPAILASLESPIGVLALPDGGFLVSSGDRVRKAWPDGSISTFAGGGDDVAATAPLAVRMGVARGLAMDPTGNIYVADLAQHLVRRITPAGSVEVVVGTIVDESGAPAGYAGDGGPASEALIGNPRGIAVHGRALYIADQGTLHVRKVSPLYAAAAPSDFDGDRRSDVAWRHAVDGRNTIWLGGDAATVKATTAVTNPAWEVVATGDFDGDGVADLFWRNRNSGANALWPAGQPSSTAVPAVTGSAWRVMGAGDFDGDGRDDLFWRNVANGRNAIWPAGQPGDAGVTGVRNLDWQVVGIGDFDGDDVADVLWRNVANGRNVIWRGGDYGDQVAVKRVAPGSWGVAAIGDLDGDGAADVLWRNASTGANVAWLGADGGATFPVKGVRNTDWHVEAIGDYDGDGLGDLFWRNRATGANVIWEAADHGMQRKTSAVRDLAWQVVPR